MGNRFELLLTYSFCSFVRNKSEDTLRNESARIVVRQCQWEVTNEHEHNVIAMPRLIYHQELNYEIRLRSKQAIHTSYLSSKPWSYTFQVLFNFWRNYLHRNIEITPTACLLVPLHLAYDKSSACGCYSRARDRSYIRNCRKSKVNYLI
jgi:hypothetical protein